MYKKLFILFFINLIYLLMDEIIFFMESLISKLLMAIPPEITKASGFNNGSICKGH